MKKSLFQQQVANLATAFFIGNQLETACASFEATAEGAMFASYTQSLQHEWERGIAPQGLL